MQKVADEFKRVIGIGQGFQWLWTVGLSVAASFASAGGAAIAALPWWSVVGIGIGAFMIALGVIATLTQRASRRSAFTPIIERGYLMRERLLADDNDGSDQALVASWRTRLDDWTAEARKTIRAIAPNREPGFTLDLLVADAPMNSDMPYWKAQLVTDLDVAIERLVLVRASL